MVCGWSVEGEDRTLEVKDIEGQGGWEKSVEGKPTGGGFQLEGATEVEVRRVLIPLGRGNAPGSGGCWWREGDLEIPALFP